MGIREGLPFPRGSSFAAGQTIDYADLPGVQLEGQVVNLTDDATISDGSNVRTIRSDGDVLARIMRNVSTGDFAMTGGRLVSHAAGYRNKRFNSYVTAAGAEAAGVLDDQLPSGGVQANDLAYVIFSGQVLIKSPLGPSEFATAWSEGDILVGLAAATSQATTAGRAYKIANTAHTDMKYNEIVNRVGRVMSATTSHGTNSDVLVDIKINA